MEGAVHSDESMNSKENGVMFKVRMSLFACLALGMVFSVPASAQNIMTVAGGGPNNVPALSAAISWPSAVAFDSSGNYYITTQTRILRVDNNGQVTVYGGGGSGGDGGRAPS